MRKVLRISLVALFATIPVMANAAEGDRDSGLVKFNAGSVVLVPHLATTSYVDGSFKATADKIDLLIDDTAVTANGEYIDKGKSVSANLKELDTGLNSVNTTVSSHTTTLNKLDGAVTVEGSVKKQIADALSDVNLATNDNTQEIQTINNKTISYVADWNNPTVKTKKISELE